MPSQHFNSVLAMQEMVEGVDLALVLDNDGLGRVCRDVLGVEDTLDNMNNVAARCVSDATASLRFRCGRNKDLRQLGVNLVPFPRMHFLTMSMAPLRRGGSGKGGHAEACAATPAPAADTASTDQAQGRKVEEALARGPGKAGSDAVPVDYKAHGRDLAQQLLHPAHMLTGETAPTQHVMRITTGAALVRGPTASRCIGGVEAVLREAEVLGRGVGPDDIVPRPFMMDGCVITPPVYVAGGEFQPDGLACTLCDAPAGVPAHQAAPASASLLLNSTLMYGVCRRMLDVYEDELRQRRGLPQYVVSVARRALRAACVAGVVWNVGHTDTGRLLMACRFLAAGMDEVAFAEAASSLRDLMCEYPGFMGADSGTESDEDISLEDGEAAGTGHTPGAGDATAASGQGDARA